MTLSIVFQDKIIKDTDISENIGIFLFFLLNILLFSLLRLKRSII